MPEVIEAEDRRVFERFSARFPAKYKDTRDDYGQTISITDASAQGLKLTTKERLYLNDVVSLEVKLPDAHLPVHLRGQVAWVRHLGEGLWETGIRFHKIRLVQMARFYKFVAPATAEAK